MHVTPSQAFHHRWCAAVAAQDLAALKGLYHPDAVMLSSTTGSVQAGAEQILAGYAQLFRTVGAMTTTAVEEFTDLGDVIRVESVRSTAFAPMLAYDVFALDDGRARVHVTGSIRPRPAAPAPPQHSVPTPGQNLHRRIWDAIDARDATALRAVYAPDAAQTVVGGVIRGADAIVQATWQNWHDGNTTRLKAVTAFTDAPQAMCAEGVAEVALQDTRFDTAYYQVWLLRAGLVTHCVTGLISPRPNELRQGLERLSDARLKAAQAVTLGMAMRVPRAW
ncbi:nuclear transport factor 2 family protein [Streptomyces sp. NRRL S-350]|uniref:nuclear transport factor 2 family protein n=1 Tax=Streptomyces sp. NRRL S-350 TaxID=1463902 RepID=UPI0004BEF711|nr:nuclear transport factor 2 family protein [Streptomyces sp. NRRL S-350]